MSEATFDILRTLLPIEATSGAEIAVMERTEALLQERGYPVERIYVDNSDRFNLDPVAPLSQARTLLVKYSRTFTLGL